MSADLGGGQEGREGETLMVARMLLPCEAKSLLAKDLMLLNQLSPTELAVSLTPSFCYKAEVGYVGSSQHPTGADGILVGWGWRVPLKCSLSACLSPGPQYFFSPSHSFHSIVWRGGRIERCLLSLASHPKREIYAIFAGG